MATFHRWPAGTASHPGGPRRLPALSSRSGRTPKPLRIDRKIVMPIDWPASRRSMPVDQWPRRDREAWRRAIEDGDIFDGAGPASRLAPVSRRNYAASYGRWLTFLKWRGELDTNAAPWDRVSRQGVGDYVEELREQVPRDPSAPGSGPLASYIGWGSRSWTTPNLRPDIAIGEPPSSTGTD